ncbi:MAG: N-acetylglutaminylglutamine synthetase [Hyphomicrobiaceae bacterium]|nr:N-acetylglutaminylglutamine synthetase [Hyphomicrobiaceae bacterium]
MKDPDRQPQPRRRNEQHRLQRMRQEGGTPFSGTPQLQTEASIDCGWGRLIFAQTFESPDRLASVLRAEAADRRDIALYVREPHVVLAAAPQEMFLDPSHTYRLDLSTHRPVHRRSQRFVVRRLTNKLDAEAINIIYAMRGMVAVPPDYFWSRRDARAITVLVAEDTETGEILGSVMGVDHSLAFEDPEHGSSLWCLAVSPQARHGGIGEALVNRLAEQFTARGAHFMDLSVLHDNSQAIALYEKLGFRRVPVFSVKRRNPINEPLFAGPPTDEDLNIYARIIVDEARRRGIGVEVTDAQSGLFRLSYGGRSVHCRESLSEFTTAIAMSICDDKRLTRRIVENAGVHVPDQMTNGDATERTAFLAKHGKVVVKPARGEQGRGISVGLKTPAAVEAAVDAARAVCEDVIIEEHFDGEDLRLVVIDYKVVAAAVRRPARVTGDGNATIRQLIETQSRRRAAATHGESRIPLDAETERSVREEGYGFDDVLPEGTDITVRKTANLHTGGTIHDVTSETHPALIETAIKVARAIEIPVTGIDLLVKSPKKPEHVFIEANERPGLANHEPHPTAERFVDLLFPHSIPQAVRTAQRRQGK